MFKISQDKVAERWDLLSDNLKESISDQINSDYIWQVCEEQHIPDEKIYLFLKFSAYVLMGFIHPEDLSKELQNATGIDKRITDDISQKINSRIFNVVKDSIDKIYTLSNSSLSQQKVPQPITNGPVILSDIINNDIPKTIPSTPISIPQNSIVKEDFNLKKDENNKTTTIDKDNNQTAKIPMPVILQENSSFAPIKQTSDFFVNFSEDKMKEMSKTPQTAPLKPAKLEFGMANKNDQNSSVINLNSNKIPSIIDKTSLNLNTDQKNRIISEITPTIPKSENKIYSNDIAKPIADIPPAPTKTESTNTLIDKTIIKPTAQINKQLIGKDKVQSFFNPIIKDQPITTKNEVIIQKDYSEIDLNIEKNNNITNKTPNIENAQINTIIPPKPQVPPILPTPPAPIKTEIKTAPIPPFIIK